MVLFRGIRLLVITDRPEETIWEVLLMGAMWERMKAQKMERIKSRVL